MSPSAEPQAQNQEDAKAIRDGVRKAYDDIAPTYLEWTKPSHKTRLIFLNKLLSRLPPPQQFNVLELGCGAGVPSTQLLAAHKNLRVTGNDISSVQIGLAKERLPDSVRLMEGDMMGLEFEKGEFDVVVGMYSLIHLPRDDQVVLLGRMFEWLKAGGWILVNLTADGFGEIRDESWLGGKDGVMFWSGLGVEGSCEALRKVGFEIEVQEVVGSIEKDEEVSFLWVLARKPEGG
jgi:ubiquinone/menaquinone biosynthesis C-methylase UbiE